MTKTARALAEQFIVENSPPLCRTLREGAKYLLGSLTVYEIPAPPVYWEICRIAKGLV